MTAARILKNKSRDTVTITTEASVGDAVDLLGQHNIGALVVSDDGKNIQGIISERDIVRRLRDKGTSLLDCTVGECMTVSVKTTLENASARNMLSRMTELRLRHLPVVDDRGSLIGMVSIGDVVKLRLDDLISEVEALHGYISNG